MGSYVLRSREADALYRKSFYFPVKNVILFQLFHTFYAHPFRTGSFLYIMLYVFLRWSSECIQPLFSRFTRKTEGMSLFNFLKHTHKFKTGINIASAKMIFKAPMRCLKELKHLAIILLKKNLSWVYQIISFKLQLHDWKQSMHQWQTIFRWGDNTISYCPALGTTRD